MYYTIYKITNQINGKIYIGSHKTCDLDDGYMGSGKYLKRAIEKNGVENFSKEILFVFDTPEEMYAKEAELVNEEFLAEANTYNLKVGGFGGWDYLNSTGLNIAWKSPVERSLKLSVAQRDRMSRGIGMSEEVLKNSGVRSPAFIKASKQGGFLGKAHTEESKDKIREKAKLRVGEKNSSFGSMWITNGIESKKIKKHDVVPDGWFRGRVQKK